MEKYIPILMEIYQEMQKENAVTNNKKEEWLLQHHNRSWEYSGPSNKYSDTMLHYLITIINKLNN